MKGFWKICWYANIAAIIYILSSFLLSTYNDEILRLFFNNLIGILIFYPLGILGLFLWVYCLVNWNRVTNNAVHLILLIFLTTIYSPIFYYLFFIKNKRNTITE